MFPRTLIPVLLIVAGLARSALVPTKPGPGEVYNAGSNCQIAWNLDTTGTWTSFSVDLMSGSNLAMTPVVNVFKRRDGTQGSNSYSFPCPDVSPNSAIYFYQFSQAGAETTWTTRFAIASATGQTTPPANPTQPDGQAIPWGVGHLASANSSSASASNTTSLTSPLNGTTTALNSTSSNATVASSNGTSTPPSLASNSSTSSTGNPTTSNPTTNRITSPGKSSTSSSTNSPASASASTSSSFRLLPSFSLSLVAASAALANKFM